MIIKFLLNLLTIVLLARFVEGVELSGLYIAIIVIFIWSLLNVTIKPLLTLLSLPIQILTLGLFSLVINALILLFIASFVEGFTISGFLPALIMAVVLSLVNLIINLFY